MKITTTLKSKYSVSPQERRQISQLHLVNGEMWPEFSSARGGDVILAKNQSRIIGWGLVFKFVGMYPSSYHIHIFVSPKWRRKGVGTIIFKRAHKKFKKLYVFKHSARARLFYESVGA